MRNRLGTVDESGGGAAEDHVYERDKFAERIYGYKSVAETVAFITMWLTRQKL